MRFPRFRFHIHPARATCAGLLLLLSAPASAQDLPWTPVTDGKSSAGLYTHGQGSVAYSPAGEITVTGGNGYLGTNKEYTHFRTRVEWYNVRGGNTGFLYHIGKDGVWPAGLECQMMSGDVGSLWTSGGARFNTSGTHGGREGKYAENGAALTQVGVNAGDRYHFVRSQDPGAPNAQWNTWEMFVKGDSLEIKVNGKVTLRIGRLTVGGAPLVKGRLGLQIEGAEVKWRNWVVQDLSQATFLAPRSAARGPGSGQAALTATGLTPSGRPGGVAEAGHAFGIAAVRVVAGRRLADLGDLNGRSLGILALPGD